MRLIGSARSILRRSTRSFRVRQISSTMSVGVTEPKSAPVGPAFTSKRSTVLPRSSAISRACSSVRASCRARSVSRLRSSATRAGVAASASRRGRRKLRAYPRATSTTSPRRPTLSTSLSRITSTPASPRVGDVREERHLARALDGDRDLPLVAAAGAGDAARADLPLLRDVAAELVVVLVVDLFDLVLAEEAALPAGRAPRRRRPLAPGLVAVFQLRHRRLPERDVVVRAAGAEVGGVGCGRGCGGHELRLAPPPPPPAAGGTGACGGGLPGPAPWARPRRPPPPGRGARPRPPGRP